MVHKCLLSENSRYFPFRMNENISYSACGDGMRLKHCETRNVKQKSWMDSKLTNILWSFCNLDTFNLNHVVIISNCCVIVRIREGRHWSLYQSNGDSKIIRWAVVKLLFLSIFYSATVFLSISSSAPGQTNTEALCTWFCWFLVLSSPNELIIYECMWGLL